MTREPNKITGANAGGPRWWAMRARWAARVAQFWTLDGRAFRYAKEVLRCFQWVTEGETDEISDDVHPHPGPLPQERVSIVTSPDDFSILVAVTDSVSFTNKTHDNPSYHIAQNAANGSPSPGGEGRGEGERKLLFH